VDVVDQCGNCSHATQCPVTSSDLYNIIMLLYRPQVCSPVEGLHYETSLRHDLWVLYMRQSTGSILWSTRRNVPRDGGDVCNSVPDNVFYSHQRYSEILTPRRTAISWHSGATAVGFSSVRVLCINGDQSDHEVTMFIVNDHWPVSALLAAHFVSFSLYLSLSLASRSTECSIVFRL